MIRRFPQEQELIFPPICTELLELLEGPAEKSQKVSSTWVAKEDSMLTIGVSSLFLALNEVRSLRSSKLEHGFLSTPSRCELERFEDGSEILREEGGVITGVDVQPTIVGVESIETGVIELLGLRLVETEEKAAICRVSCLF